MKCLSKGNHITVVNILWKTLFVRLYSWSTEKPTFILSYVKNSQFLSFSANNSNDMTSSYPDLASPTDSVIAGDFGSLSAAEQERQRDEWKAELTKTEEEIHTLRQVTVN